MQIVVLDATTKKLQLVLDEAATTELDYVTSYIDVTATAATEGSTTGTSNDTTAVDIVPAPAASTRRIVKDISIYNPDSIDHNITVIYDDNGTDRVLWYGQLKSESVWYLSRVLSSGGSVQLYTKIFFIPGTFPSSATTNLSIAWHAPAALTISTIDLFVETAGSGTGSTVVDVNKNGTTITTSKLTLTTTGTSHVDLVPSTTAVAKGDVITIDVDSITSTAPSDGSVVIHYTLD